MSRNKADKTYNQILNDYIYPLIGRDVTYDFQLMNIGKMLFDNKFKGVYPSDKIPKLTHKQPYAILNLDKSHEGGSHWVAVVKLKNGDIMLYDSFGRPHTTIIKSLITSGNGSVINSELDAEQKIEENDCGARSLAFILTHHILGEKYSIYI